MRVVQFGLGSIGRGCVRELAGRAGVEVVGGIDRDPELAGRDLGEVCGLGHALGASVRSDPGPALAGWRPEIVIHTTGSFLAEVEEQIAAILAAGAHVVSSSEELFFPRAGDRAAASRIDGLARQHGLVVVGTGVNPGFAMDLLPVCLSGICVRVDRIAVSREVDAATRRAPLQKKVGAGMSAAEFERRAASGGIGHVGLRQSALAVADALAWSVDGVDERLTPVIAARDLHAGGSTIAAGRVAGIDQRLRLRVGGKERLALDLRMFVGASDPHDRIEIAGEPPLSVRVEGGIAGDIATVAALINTLPRLTACAPGLRTVMDLPVPRALPGGVSHRG